MDFSFIISQIRKADLKWVILSIAISLVAHYLRAYRWNMLLHPIGYYPQKERTFIAVMVGYFVNLLLPRAGEISRCVVLKRTDEVPLSSGIGTVVSERIIDFITLILILISTFLLESGRLFYFFQDTFLNRIPRFESGYFWVIAIIMTALIIIAAMLWFYWGKLVSNPLFEKIRSLFRELAKGLLSVGRLKSPLKFLLATVSIWTLYFLMSYLVFFAFEETSGLGFGAGMAILVMGGLGMSAPVQGGIGTFHALVAAVLLIFGIQEEAGKLFAFLLHSSHVLSILLFGGISLLISFNIERKNSKVVHASN